MVALGAAGRKDDREDALFGRGERQQ